MDMRLGDDLFESFVNYQAQMLEQYEEMTSEYGFQVLDASLPVEQLNEQLKQKFLPLLPHG
jgi:thymidylate kinase